MEIIYGLYLFYRSLGTLTRFELSKYVDVF